MFKLTPNKIMDNKCKDYLRRAAIREKLLKIRTHFQNTPKLLKQIEILQSEHDMFKKLYEEELTASMLRKETRIENYSETFITLQEDYTKMNKAYEALLAEQMSFEKKLENALILKENSIKKQEEMFSEKFQDIRINGEKEKHKLEINIRKDIDVNQHKLRKMMNANNMLRRENSELLLQEREKHSNTDTIKQYKNAIIQRAAQLSKLEKELATANAEQTSLYESTAASEVTYEYGNDGNNDNIENVTMNMQPTQREQTFQYIANTLPPPSLSSPTHSKNFDDDWDEEDYEKYQQTCFYIPSAKPSAKALCTSTGDNAKAAPVSRQDSHCNITSSTDWVIQPQPSTSRLVEAKPRMPSRPKKRKLLNESMLNVSILQEADCNSSD